MNIVSFPELNWPLALLSVIAVLALAFGAGLGVGLGAGWLAAPLVLLVLAYTLGALK